MGRSALRAAHEIAGATMWSPGAPFCDLLPAVETAVAKYSPMIRALGLFQKPCFPASSLAANASASYRGLLMLQHKDLHGRKYRGPGHA